VPANAATSRAASGAQPPAIAAQPRADRPNDRRFKSGDGHDGFEIFDQPWTLRAVDLLNGPLPRRKPCQEAKPARGDALKGSLVRGLEKQSGSPARPAEGPTGVVARTRQ